jgi:hypothetical protein
MPQTVLPTTLIATKLASGNVQLMFQSPIGGIQFVAVIPSADFTSFNTTVNGGATGANLTKAYGTNMNIYDYPQTYAHGEGN